MVIATPTAKAKKKTPFQSALVSGETYMANDGLWGPCGIRLGNTEVDKVLGIKCLQRLPARKAILSHGQYDSLHPQLIIGEQTWWYCHAQGVDHGGYIDHFLKKRQ